jgi:hypothetical protein
MSRLHRPLNGEEFGSEESSTASDKRRLRLQQSSIGRASERSRRSNAIERSRSRLEIWETGAILYETVSRDG